MRAVLIDLGGTSTGGGQSMCRTTLDECADFETPDGRVISVMFSMNLDDDMAYVWLSAHREPQWKGMHRVGRPAQVLNVLVDTLEALGCRPPVMR